MPLAPQTPPSKAHLSFIIGIAYTFMRVAHHQTTPYHRPICLQNCDAIKQLLKLQLQAAAGLDVESIGYWSGPPAWIASARAAAKPCLMNWENGKAELADLLCGSSSTLMSPLAYCNGAFFKCQISYVKVEEGTAVAISVRYEISELARVIPEPRRGPCNDDDGGQAGGGRECTLVSIA